MKTRRPVVEQSAGDGVIGLISQIHEAQERLQEAADGGVDAVVHSSGQSYLMHDAQERLRQSEARFHGLFNAAATGIAISTPEGRYLRANAAYCEMLGYSEDELKVMDFASLTHPSDLMVNLKSRDELLAGERESFVMEKRYIRKDGGILWTRASVAATRGAQGEVATMIVVTEDITEQKNSAESLKRSIALLDLAGRLGRMGAWAVELPSMALTLSTEARAIHEMAPEFVPSVEDAINFYRPEDRPTVSQAVEACMREGTPFDLELQIVTATGRPVWIRSIGQAQKDSSDAIQRIHGAVQDISERKANELELARINRALVMLSKCNETLIRTEDERVLLDAICQICVEIGGYRMAWVGYAQHDDYHTVAPMAHAGVEEGYLDEAKLSWSEDEPAGRGPGGRAIRSGKAVVCDDINLEPAFSHMLAAARKRGYNGVVCLPLLDADRAFGLLGLYSADIKPTSAEEINLLQELADDLSFGILNLRKRFQQKRLQEAVLNLAITDAAAAGNQFFEQLARNMAEAVGAIGAFIAELLPGEPLTARTLAAVVEGKAIANFDYLIEGTPSESLLTANTWVIEKQVAMQLPHIAALAEINAQGYAGQRLDSSTGHAIGQLSVVFREPLTDIEFVTSTVHIFAARAVAEMERRQTDAKVREQSALLDIAHEAIRVDDLEGTIIYWNKGAERIYGWSAADAVGRKSEEILCPKADTLQEARTAVLAEGEWRGETTKRTKNGEEIAVEVGWTLVRDERGEPKSILAINTDITKRKRLEEEFLRAQRLDSIGTLASGLAHDLNNILAPITMCAPMLRGGLPAKDAEELLTTIETSAARGAQIIRQVLTFGRGIKGQRRPMQIAKVIDEIAQIARETFPRNIHIETRVALNLWRILGDATQWHQVLMNLAVNARDSMEAGGSLLIIAENLTVDAHYASMTEGLSKGPHIAIELTDSGTGIPPDVIERIFDPFFTTKEVGKGTGLGLSTVIGIVKSHGGAIKLTSQIGIGTTFRLIVPATGQESDPDGDDPEMAAHRGNGQTILIADDEENVRNAARVVLEANGYRTLLAADGAEALTVYARNSDVVDALLTDLTMPLMDGMTLIRSVQRMSPGLAIIASTGETKSNTEADLKRLGLEMALQKPYSAGTLLRAVHAALKKER